MLLSKRHKLRRNFARRFAIECHHVRGPRAMEDREQQQRVFGSFSEHFRLFDQHPRSLDGRFGLWRSVAFHVEERGYERHLELDFLLPTGRSARQRCDLGKCAPKLLYRFDQR